MNAILIQLAGLVCWFCLSSCGVAAKPLEGDPNPYLKDVNLDDVNTGDANTGDDVNKGIANAGQDVNEGEVDQNSGTPSGQQQIREEFQNKDKTGENQSSVDIDKDNIPNEQDDDIDGDGIANINDADIDGDGIANTKDPDKDGDGIPDAKDNDLDGDGIKNIDDNDIDGDGILNEEDDDIDGDGIINQKDLDIDGDGILNVEDNDIDGDGIVNSEDSDIDGDGKLNTEDPDIDGDGISNEDDKDADGDGNPDDRGQEEESSAPSNSSEGTQVVITEDKTVAFGLKDKSSLLIQEKILDLTDIRKEAEENDMELANAIITKVHVTAASSQILQDNQDMPFQLLIRNEVQNLQSDILYTRDLSSTDPGPQKLGDLQAGIDLNQELFLVPANWSTFEKILKGEIMDENGEPFAQSKLYFIFLFAEPIEGDGEMNLDFDLEFTGAKRI